MSETSVPGFYADHVFISLSGGLDSTCLMMAMLASGKTVHAISFKYGQKHSIELKKVAKNIKFLQKLGMPVDHHIVDLTSAFALSQSSLHSNSTLSIPHDKYDSKNQRSTVISNRNVIFSAIIYGMALDTATKINGNVLISMGVHSNDNSVYPDCRPESVKMAAELYHISNWNSDRVEYVAPFVNLNKGEVLQAGIAAMESMSMKKAAIKKVLSNTLSCYDVDEQGRSCGRCGTCQERRAAFKMVGMTDPIEYKEPEENLPEVESL